MLSVKPLAVNIAVIVLAWAVAWRFGATSLGVSGSVVTPRKPVCPKHVAQLASVKPTIARTFTGILVVIRATIPGSAYLSPNKRGAGDFTTTDSLHTRRMPLASIIP